MKMMNFTKYLLFAVLAGMLTFSACDVLNKQPLDEISGDAVWTDPALVEAYVNHIYLRMGHGLYEIMHASMNSDMLFIHNYGQSNVVKASSNPSDRGDTDDRRLHRT